MLLGMGCNDKNCPWTDFSLNDEEFTESIGDVAIIVEVRFDVDGLFDDLETYGGTDEVWDVIDGGAHPEECVTNGSFMVDSAEIC